VVVNVDQSGDNRLANLDVDISDMVIFQTLPAHVGHNNTVHQHWERDPGLTPSENHDRGRGLSIIANVHNVDASSLDFHRVQESVILERQVTLPDVLDRMVSYNFAPGVMPPGRWVPSKERCYFARPRLGRSAGQRSRNLLSNSDGEYDYGDEDARFVTTDRELRV